MIRAALRSSPLSLAQAKEVFSQLSIPHQLILLESSGDRDRKRSLRTLDKSDFFTKEIDEEVISGRADVAIHSAKDLPDLIPSPLHVIALTKGLSSKDALVYHPERGIFPEMKVATSSANRENMVRRMVPSARFIDVRGTIHERLALIDQGCCDGVVIAEAALERLGLFPPRLLLEGETAPYQGRLAIVARRERRDLEEIFSKIDAREPKTLYFGLRNSSPLVFHAPLIEIEPLNFELSKKRATHLIFTSQTAVEIYAPYIRDEKIIAVGKKTAQALKKRGFEAETALLESQEGICALLAEKNLMDVHIVLPGSEASRASLFQWLDERKISFERIILYRPRPIQTYVRSDLAKFEKLLFSSPSQVDAFCALYNKPFPHQELEAIGPITLAALRKSFPHFRSVC